MRSGKAIFFMFFLLSVPSLSLAALSNLPAGSNVLLDCAFTSITCLGAVQNNYNAGQIMTDLSAPDSPPSIYRYSRCATCVQGGTQLDYFYSNASEIYVGLVIRTSPNFPGFTSSSNKITMQGNNINNFTLGLYGSQGGPHQLFWNDQNGGQLNNCHYAQSFVGGGAQANGPTVYGDCPGGLNYFPNVGDGTWTHGVWHYAEWCGKASTSTTSRDGIYKWLLDGRIVGNYPNVNTAQFYNASYITPAWDGGGTPWGIDAWWDVDRWIVARLPVGGCAALAGGTSPTPPPPSSPPPPSPTPPPTSGTPGTVSDLTVVPLSSTTARVTFTQQDDGTGVSAKYDNRLAVSPISWGSASSVTVGPCSSPYAPAGIIGSQVSCDLSGLTPGQSYQMQNVAFRGTMNAGATYGALGNIASFTMPSSNVPTITTFSPATGQAGTSITITGTNFGATIGANTVKCNGQTATITAASPTSLTITAPDGVTTGKISVQTDQGIVYSEQNFTVGAASNGCGCS